MALSSTFMTWPFVAGWAGTLTYVFGGCCSNAITLEQVTSTNPRLGTLVTFSQYLLISVLGLLKFVEFKPWPSLRPRRIPLTAYLLQVFLFYLISVLNNAAFAYKIPMPVHIIFRSGGLVVSMFMGWLLLGRRYRRGQVFGVLLVTVGVLLTTMSASKPGSSKQSPSVLATSSTWTYAIGISLLTLALFLGSFLGIAQDRMYTKYGKHSTPGKPSTTTSTNANSDNSGIEPWHESMFYLHFLGMPMFLFMRHDLLSQFVSTKTGPRVQLALPITLDFLPASDSSIFSITHAGGHTHLDIPAVYGPLSLNAITQLICVAGVHRLASRISSLAVTLTLVVRKALSMVISVVWFGDNLAMDTNQKIMLWAGATLVFAGTILYSLTSTSKKDIKTVASKKEE